MLTIFGRNDKSAQDEKQITNVLPFPLLLISFVDLPFNPYSTYSSKTLPKVMRFNATHNALYLVPNDLL